MMKRILILLVVMTACSAEEAIPSDKDLISASEATGKYWVTGTMDYDSCTDQASDTEMDLGPWILAESQQKSYFFNEYGLILESEDGLLFTAKNTILSPTGLPCQVDILNWEAAPEFTKDGFDSQLYLTWEMLKCFNWGEESFDKTCERSYSMHGIRKIE
jgi:hypothetical protein